MFKITQLVISRARAERQTCQGRSGATPGKATYSQHGYLMSLDLEKRFKKGPCLTHLRMTTQLPTKQDSRTLLNSCSLRASCEAGTMLK